MDQVLRIESIYLHLLAKIVYNLLFSSKKNHNNKRKYFRLCMC